MAFLQQNDTHPLKAAVRCQHTDVFTTTTTTTTTATTSVKTYNLFAISCFYSNKTVDLQ